MQERHGGDHGPGEGDADWMTGYLARSADFWRRAMRLGVSLAATWGERSLTEEEWTTDSVTADVMEAWDELTPLTGEGLELWLELVRRTLRSGGAEPDV